MCPVQDKSGTAIGLEDFYVHVVSLDELSTVTYELSHISSTVELTAIAIHYLVPVAKMCSHQQVGSVGDFNVSLFPYYLSLIHS